MRSLLPGLVALLLLAHAASALAQEGRAGLEAVARALGASGLRSIEYTGSGTLLAVGQSPAPGQPWPPFGLRRFTRAIDYDAAAMRDDLVRVQVLDPPRGGGVQPVRGEQRQVFVLRGDHAWNMAGDAAVPAPLALPERQAQLWLTPHGVVKAALAHGGVRQGRTLTFTLPGRVPVRATLDGADLVERVEAVLPHPVVGDLPLHVAYADYRDFGGVKFPTRIRQTAGGFPSLDLVVSDVRPNAAVDVAVPAAVRETTRPYARVASQMVADGVWYVTGGSHHSVVIEMQDHLIVVEAPLNDERALAVIGEARALSDKPIRYVVNSHHHFDHSGGLRAFAGEGATIITHEVNRAFFERALGTPATRPPDHLARSGKKSVVEGVRERRVLGDATRTVEIHHMAGNPHDDGLLMVYLPREKLLVQADAYTPLPAGAAPPMPPSPFTLNLVENLTRLGLAVDRLLPLHGRLVPLAELHRTVGR